jgi:hypothetical protein
MDTPELTSVEAFVEHLLDDDRTQVTFEETVELATALGQSIPTNVIHELQQYGIQVGERAISKRVRGFRSNSHDRWSAYPSHGGSGWEQITGFAGDKR